MVGSDANGTLVHIAAGTNGQVLTQTAGGPAWQPISAWQITGNAGTNGGSTVAAGVNFLGTTDITVTPAGNSNGVYFSSVDADGFWVTENNNGQSNVDLSWIAMDVRKGSETLVTSPEILDATLTAK